MVSGRSTKNNTVVTFADPDNGQYSRSNTAIGPNGVITDEELVKVDAQHNPTFSHSNRQFTSNRKSNTVEGQYTDQGRVFNTDSQQSKSPQNIANNTSVFLKTISSINPHNESIIENNNSILQKSREMKAHLEAYIDQIHQINESQMQETMKMQNQTQMTVQLDDEQLRAKVYEVFNQEKDKMGEQILRKLQQGTAKDGQKDSDVMDEFYEFCRNKLPSDEMYKESVLFVSLFYYFLEKKNLIK